MSLRRFFDQIERRVDRLVDTGAFIDKKIVIFGASVTDGRCKRWLEERGCTVDAIIDNSTEKIGREYLGLTVRAPEEVLLPFDPDRVVVITSPSYWSEMSQQVVQMGYARRTQVFSVGAPTRRPTWWMFLQQITRAIRGAISFRRLARSPDGRRTIFMTPVPPAGDVYIECLFIRQYVRRHGVRRFVIAVPNEACRRMVELFGFEHVVVLSEDELWRMVDYVRVARRGPQDLVVMHYPSLNGSVAQLQGYKGLNFEKMFRYAAFDLDDDVPHDVPSSATDRQAVEATLIGHGLRPGRTVILAPYARSLVHGHDVQFWNGVAAELIARGYDVCTSGFGPEEPAIAGTTLLKFPFSQAVQYVESAGFFIGLRSGLCDVISSANAVKVILHERGPWFKTSMFQMFSLNAMDLCDDAVEFDFASSQMNAVQGEIMEALV